jgi:hypothetical protein
VEGRRPVAGRAHPLTVRPAFGAVGLRLSASLSLASTSMTLLLLSSATVAESGLATGASATFVTVTLTVAEAMFPCASTIVYVKLSGP